MELCNNQTNVTVIYLQSLSSMGRYTFGSHELMFCMSFGEYARFFRYLRRYEFQYIRGSGRRVYNYNE